MAEQEPTSENMTMLQGFEWYVPADKKHWARLEKNISQFKQYGIDNIWIPPGCKGSSPEGNGYDIYDLYDLGEFDQKGSKATKWGPREDLDKLFATAKDNNVGLYWDAVLNHKFAADHREKCMAAEVDENDRTRFVTDKYEIEAWVGFDFPARNDKYSKMKYHWYHFSGVDYNAKDQGKKAIYKIMGEQGEGWASVPDVDDEKGNYDYLMGSDLDYSHPEVESDVIAWGEWLANTLPIKGIRFDAVKHYSEEFLRKFIGHLNEKFGEGWFFVGEFWKDDLNDLREYLGRMNSRFSLFDTPLCYNFSEISGRERADMRQVFDGTLVQNDPINAVTLVMNHDTQPDQALEAPVADWFKPLAYALILLRESGYPCVFYGDLFGTRGPHPTEPSGSGSLPKLTVARKVFAYGRQADYFDNGPNCLGWVRYGTWDRPSGCAVVVSNAEPATIRMHVGEMHAGQVWTDVLGWGQKRVTIGDDGFGDFDVGGCSVCVYVDEKAEGRERINDGFNYNIYEE